VGQLPRLRDLQDAYKGYGARIVAVVQAGGAGRAWRIKFDNQLTFPVLHTGTTLYGYWITRSPEVYVLDREHRFVANIRGYSDWADSRVKELLDLLLGLRQPEPPNRVESP